ncbi:MAG: hypothetical protein H7201_04905 [Candidatus Saccharibacteria bacterium]|nr:hypothetical protein [Microbacteriaceae bacterium]
MLELRAEGMTGRAIALAHGMSRKSVLAVFDAADRAGIGRDGLVGRSDAEVYQLVFPLRSTCPANRIERNHASPRPLVILLMGELVGSAH